MRHVALSKPPDIAIYGLVGALCWYLAWLTSRRYDVRGVELFGAVLVLEGVWAFNSTAKLIVQDVGVQLLLARTDVVMLLVVPLAWFAFASAYLGKVDGQSRALLAVGGAVAFLGGAMAILSPEGTIWTALEVVEDPFLHVHPIPSRLYVGLALVAGLLFAAGFVRIVEAVLTTRGTTLAMVALAIGMTFPAFFMLEYVLQLGIFHQVNYTSMGVGAFMILTTAAVFSDLFAVNPIPRKDILASVDDGVLVLDDNRRVVDYNGRLEEYFEPETGAVIGEPVDAAFPALAEAITLEDGSETTITVDREGEERSYRLGVAEIRPRDSTIGWDVVATDVTALERQQQELRRQNEQLDRFASAVSHDLKNPLNVAGLSIELALEGDDEQLPRAAGAIDRMETIIEDLLALTREGQSVGDLESVDVETVAREAWATIDGGSLVVERTGNIVADRDRLTSIFENLFHNATEHGGDDVTVRVALEDHEVVVEDDGPGIAPSERERVFEYGFSTAEDGTGLGLAIVETMVQAHKWDVRVEESSEGGGRFVVSGVRRADGRTSSAESLTIEQISE